MEGVFEWYGRRNESLVTAVELPKSSAEIEQPVITAMLAGGEKTCGL